MSQVKRITFESIVGQFNEAIPLSTAKDYIKQTRRPGRVENALNNIFEKIKTYSSDIKSSKRGDRLFIPISFNKRYEPKSENEEEIGKFLNEKGFFIDDYMSGSAYKDDENDRRTYNIGKLLSRFENKGLLNKFNSDPSRVSTKRDNGYIVISKHPYDIVGMSTGRGWSSCMGLDTENGKTFMPMDIDLGTIVAYLVNPDDLNIKNPIARIAIKPYENMEDISDILYFPNHSVYGSAPVQFYYTVYELFERIQDEKFGEFKLNTGIYNDCMPRYKSLWTYDMLKKKPGMLLNMGSVDLMEVLKKYPEFSTVMVKLSGNPLNNYLAEGQLIKMIARHPSIIDDVEVSHLTWGTIIQIIKNNPDLRPKIHGIFENIKNKIVSGNLKFEELPLTLQTNLENLHPNVARLKYNNKNISPN